MGAEKWIVNIIGERLSDCWEISIVKEDCQQLIESYGWDGVDKRIIGRNSHLATWQFSGFIFDENVKIANELCRRINDELPAKKGNDDA